jgi:hypothetical protein
MAIIVSQEGFQADYLINSARALYGRAKILPVERTRQIWLSLQASGEHLV